MSKLCLYIISLSYLSHFSISIIKNVTNGFPFFVVLCLPKYSAKLFWNPAIISDGNKKVFKVLNFYKALLVWKVCKKCLLFQALPVWKSSLSGSISFMFRTNEPNGLLLFNGGGNPGKVNDGLTHFLFFGKVSKKITKPKLPWSIFKTSQNSIVTLIWLTGKTIRPLILIMSS